MSFDRVKILSSENQKDSPENEPSPGPPDWVPSLLKDRVDQNVFNELTQVRSEKACEPMSKNNSKPGNKVSYIGMEYAIDSSHSKSEILDKFENNVVTDAEWYRILFQEDCKHDQENPGDCSNWSIEREGGTVPEGL